MYFTFTLCERNKLDTNSFADIWTTVQQINEVKLTFIYQLVDDHVYL